MSAAAQPNPSAHESPARRDVIVVGGSAGAVFALMHLLGLLPRELPASVVVVTHLSPWGRSALDEVLRSHTALRVKFAEEREALRPGVVYLPVPDRHLLVTREGLRLTRGPREARSRPAVDALFRSAAVAFGPRVIGVVLTGYLDDGAAGLWAIKDRGGIALVQDPDTAEARSMPESAIDAVDVDFVGDVTALGNEIVRLSGSPIAVEGLAMASSGRQDIENRIALEVNGLEAGVMRLGQPSPYTCPECHGVLLKIEEGRRTRFRCHTGHAYSEGTLLTDLDDMVDRSLWASLRALEERLLLLRAMADEAERAAKPELAARYRNEADAATLRMDTIESMLHQGESSEEQLKSG